MVQIYEELKVAVRESFDAWAKRTPSITRYDYPFEQAVFNCVDSVMEKARISRQELLTAALWKPEMFDVTETDEGDVLRRSDSLAGVLRGAMALTMFKELLVEMRPIILADYLDGEAAEGEDIDFKRSGIWPPDLQPEQDVKHVSAPEP